MEPVKKKAASLRQSFFLYVMLTFALAVVLSGGVIYGCFAVQQWLLPESNQLYLNIEHTDENGTKSTAKFQMQIGEDMTEIPYMLSDTTDLGSLINAKYAITSIETGFDSLTPKRQLLYRGCGVVMVALPILLSFLGILFCGYCFYRKKLKTPIELLSRATDKIAGQDLDFTLSYPVPDEFGALCSSFEQMRAALQENNKKMWGMLEERRRLQASVAHDLRNPIAIIEGHAEYLQLNLHTGKLSRDKILSIAANIENAAKRLECYTESIRSINHLEELEISRNPVDFSELHDDMAADFMRMAEAEGIAVYSENLTAVATLNVDPQVLYRILENLIGNALRYAKSEIHLSFSCSDNQLCVTVKDDGPGFPNRILQAKNQVMFPGGSDETHSGLGLTICRILCQKHGGSLTLGNLERTGAVVKFALRV